MKQKVVCDLLQDLGEAQDAFTKLPFLLVIQQDFRGLGCFTQGVLLDVCHSGYRPGGEQRCVTRDVLSHVNETCGKQQGLVANIHVPEFGSKLYITKMNTGNIVIVHGSETVDNLK